MNGAPPTALTLRTPPRYGRRAVWSLLAALGLFGLSFAIDEAAAIFSEHRCWASVNEEKRGTYQREYTALSEILRDL